MRVVGFNVGRIRPQVIDGEEVLTGYVKSPVPEPWVITPTGAEGDEVAVHSDHLYAIDRAAYDYWAEELGVDRATWSDGLFAENLTLDTLDQAGLRVGDRFRVGTAVVVVTGPRVPCWKLTWRLGQPKTFMRRFRVSGRSGAYLGVVEPGVVRPGDELVPIGGDPQAPTVAELSRLCASGSPVSADERVVVERALASSDLSDTVRATLTLKMANPVGDAPGWPGWRRFRIDRVVPETPEVTSFVLRPADGGSLPSTEAGQHVVVRLSEDGREPVVRTWSLSGHAPEPDHYRITVRLRPDGLGSAALARAAPGTSGAVGDLGVELRAPAGRFRLDRGSFRPVVLVAAGIGITPLVAMVASHLARSGHVPPVWVLHGAPDSVRAPFREHLEDLARRHEDVNLHYFLSQIGEDGAPADGPATVHAGRLSSDRVVEVLRGNYLRTPDGPASIPWFESDLYLCGGIEFTARLREGLVAAGANPDLVRVEDFAAAARTPSGPGRTSDARVRFAPSGVEATWVAAQERTLLELGEDHRLDLPSDCRTGTCRTCEAVLVGGEVEGPVTTGPDGVRRVLLCSSYPASDRVEIGPEE